MPLVTVVSGTTLSIVFAAGLTPDAVAKQADPLITLSQVQGFHSPVMLAPQTSIKPKTRQRPASRTAGAAKKKGKTAALDHFRLGLALKAKGNTNRALIEFLKASQKNPRQINAFYEQALIFRKQGYLKLADSALEQAIRIANSTAKSSDKKLKAPFTQDDLNRIRLLLITVRLEQGNVGSAAEELSRSLGIALSVPPSNSSETEKTAPTSMPAEPPSPTTILQSLHPSIRESAKTEQDSQLRDEFQADEKTSASETQAGKQDKPSEMTVTSFIKDGLAGLKDHVFNPLSVLGLQRISSEQEKTKSNSRKERRAKKSRKEPQRKEPKTKASEKAAEIAKSEDKVQEDERLTKVEKKKRRSWFDRRLALAAETPPVKTADAREAVEEQQKTEEPISQGVKESSDLALTSKTAAVTFTPEEAETKDERLEKKAPERAAENGSFSLSMPPAVSQKISLVAALLSAFGQDGEKNSAAEKPKEMPKDPIEERLRYLAEHGTSSLKEGEAFMFSEESGEATLFMSNGEVIRKTIAVARRHEEVAQLRRPDILIPEELIYNLALMAKILPKQDEPKETVGEPVEEAPKLKMPAKISVPELKPYSFSDWLRGVLNL